MKRFFLQSLFAMALTMSQANTVDRMLVGTYTDTGSHGIYSLEFDAATGRATVLDSLHVVNPSFLTTNRDHTRIYAVSELTSDSAALCAISLDPASGHMEMINRVPTVGQDPCFVEVSDDLALTANYSLGSMTAFRIAPDGSLLDNPQVFAGTTSGNSPQQQVAHVHTTRFFEPGIILATDFSADRIVRYSIADGKVVPDGVAGETLPDSGPRHLEWSADRRTVYSINELGGTVTVFANRDSRLERIQTIESGNACADIHLSPDGRYLYTSNRIKDDGITIYAVNSADGTLTRVGNQPTGIHPRNFAITPDGNLLLCACRDSDVIELYRIDHATGLLTRLDQNIHLPHPVCIHLYSSF